MTPKPPGPGSGPAGARPGRRALFSDPAAGAGPGPVDQDVPAGRRAFFSAAAGSKAADGSPATAPAAAAGRGGGRGPVVVCRTCLARTPVSVVDLGRSLLPSLWLPTRPWSHLMRCPACRRVGWCRLEWPRPGAG